MASFSVPSASLKIKTSDGDIVESDVSIINHLITLKNMYEDLKNMCEDLKFGEMTHDGTVVPVQISTSTMKLVVKFVEHLKTSPNPEPSEKKDKEKGEHLIFDPWETEFLNLERSALFELILAANFLECKPLLDLGCRKVASMINGKTVAEIRETFNIVNDFTPEEEEKIRKDNEWITEYTNV